MKLLRWWFYVLVEAETADSGTLKTWVRMGIGSMHRYDDGRCKKLGTSGQRSLWASRPVWRLKPLVDVPSSSMFIKGFNAVTQCSALLGHGGGVLGNTAEEGQ